MLHAVHTSTNPPQMMPPRVPRLSRSKLNRATSIVDCAIAPILEEADLMNDLFHMKDENDILGAISLYDAMIASADAPIVHVLISPVNGSAQSAKLMPSLTCSAE
jgi:hypothetical protein